MTTVFFYLFKGESGGLVSVSWTSDACHRTTEGHNFEVPHRAGFIQAPLPPYLYVLQPLEMVFQPEVPISKGINFLFLPHYMFSYAGSYFLRKIATLLPIHRK